MRKRLLPLAVALLTAACSTSSASRSPTNGEWPAYGRDGGGMRHSPLTHITKDNVGRLTVAWTYRTGETDFASRAGQRSAFEATPILVDGVLYLSTPLGKVVALDPSTGNEKWKYDAAIDPTRGYSEVTSRGVSTWKGPDGVRRIYLGTIDARLIALNAANGTLLFDFGKGGVIDLSAGMERVRPGQYQVTSPPAIIGDTLVIGSSVGDNGGVELERGVVRAFDARTGVQRWSWDPIATASPGDDSWRGEGWKKTGAANAWSILSVDERRGLVFVPTSSPSPDYYGGERLGTNAHANSVIALEAKTGRVVWSFQVVRHDLWDYDVAAQPMLIDVPKEGRAVPAVAVGTKMGMIFLLDRETGKPLYPVEERAVPASDVAGEEAWPTQVFPTRPAPVVPQALRIDDAFGVTEKDRQWCREMLASARNDGIYTPPSLGWSLAWPGNVGGIHWGGMTYDPVRQILVTNTNRVPTLIKLIPRDQADAYRRENQNRVGGEWAAQRGTPFALYRQILITPGVVPCSPPPFGALTAIDLRSGEKKWEVPLGTMPQLASVPGAESYGSINLGGASNAGGLVFIAAAMDTVLRAFDIETGSEVWSADLPASAQATPMIYEARGRQFVVISAGGHGKLGTKRGDYVVAFALP